MIRYKYIKIPIDIIPEENILEYNLTHVPDNGHEYFEIRKRMYGLTQVGILFIHTLLRRIDLKGYAPCKHTPGIWRHKCKPGTL